MRIFALLLVMMTNFAQADYVKPYYRRDGTFVNGHYKTKANRIKSDNYSSWGNSSPTGKKGRDKSYLDDNWNESFDDDNDPDNYFD